MNNSNTLIMYCQVTFLDCDENGVYNETRTIETFSTEDSSLEYTSNGDRSIQYVQVDSTATNDIDDDIPSTMPDNSICIQNQAVPTYSTVEGNDVYIICSCRENEACVHSGNKNNEEPIEGDISSTPINKPSDISTKALEELHIRTGQRTCCCESGVSSTRLPCGHIYFCQ
ncbi:uncharacterized protein LOC117610916 [Osmia lignaria lignaria]|uniref:uncharacterized protein LOC117610916 n=1 Tax=Osmia lignaria lignaria TaxID=1437193 RepID=UPI00402B43E7